MTEPTVSPNDSPVTGMPFSAVVGQDDAKLALLLAAAQPLIGGVLLRGDKGSAKSTLARSLAALLPGDAPFVELPLGATEDRVIGSVDLGALLRDGTPSVRPGLLAAANGGVLYVDEINLLADHLIDVLLDVAVSGINRIERDGIAHQHPARFVLIGSMNPEEGELRPQLLDRFGFSVDVRSSELPSERAAAVRRRLSIDSDSAALDTFATADANLKQRLGSWTQASVPDALIEAACALAVAVGAEGLRADLMLCRGAAAHAGWHGHAIATEDDVRSIAGLVLAHRRRRSPLEPPGISDADLGAAFDQAFGDHPDTASGDHGSENGPNGEIASDRVGDDRSDEPNEPDRPDDPFDGNRRSGSNPTSSSQQVPVASAPPPRIVAGAASRALAGRRGSADDSRGRFVRSAAMSESRPTVAVTATAIALTERRAGDPSVVVGTGDLRGAVRSSPTGNLVILCVDASGSMGAESRMAMAKGAALGLLTDAYQRRDRIALITFAGDDADVVLRPTASIEIAQSRMRDLPTGGSSPVAEGLDAVLRLVAGGSGDQALQPLLVLITDGRATGSPDALQRSHDSARRLAERRIAAVVIDAESGPTRLGLAAELAALLAAPCLPLDSMIDGSLERTIRLQLG